MKNTNEKLAEEIRAFKNTDFSDNPELTAAQLAQLKPSHRRPQNMVNMDNYKPIKKGVYVRIDADVLEWLKGSGEGYQTRLNSILRQAMAENV
ncbi:BrnA antitoxin family protein [Treponema primitia]|uniref:BrnA antitoxin family protein n=1 Tax=Treponema primitia TaxID=88058 RepID=UPI00397EBC08